MKLRFRILGLSGLLGIFFLSLIGYTLIVFSTTSQAISRIVEENLATEQVTERLNTTILRIRSDIWDTMVFDLSHRSRQVDLLNEQAREFYRDIRELTDKNPGLTGPAGVLRGLFQSYYQFGSTILNLKTLEEFIGLKDTVEKFKANQTALTDRLSEIVDTTKAEFFQALDRLKDNFIRTTATAFFLSGVVLILSFFFSFLIAGRLARPLEMLTATAHKVSEGNFEVRPQIRSGGGEIRSLATAFTLMLDQIQQYSSRMEDLVRVRTAELAKANQTMVRELEFAKKIQGAMIPKSLPQSGPLTMGGIYLPLEELGGDFFDAFETGPGIWTMVIADVSGHGVPAALVTSMVKVSLGTHAKRGRSPGEVLDQVNREIFLTIGDVHQFVTMVYCVINLERGTLEYCSAGQNFLILRANGELEERGPNSGVVGLMADEIYFSEKTSFREGDTLFLFTDGVTEARDDDLKMYSFERLQDFLREQRNLTPQGLVNAVTESVQTYLRGRPAQDDITLVVARREPEGARSKAEGDEVAESIEPLDALKEAERRYWDGDYQGVILWTLGIKHPRLSKEAQGDLYHWAAMAHYRMGRLKDAEGYWGQAVQMNPRNRRAQRNLDLLRKHLQRRDK